MTVASIPACNVITAATIAAVNPSTTWTVGIAAAGDAQQRPFREVVVVNTTDISIDVCLDAASTLTSSVVHDTLGPNMIGNYELAKLGLLGGNGGVYIRQNTSTDPTIGTVTVSCIR